MGYERELEVALRAAEEAGKLIREHYEKFTPIPDAPSDISTEADRASQELILQAIRHEFPSDALCAEENTPSLSGAMRSGDRLWIVDPIDGTRGFAVKNGEFSVMIGFVDRGVMQAGVVLEPAIWRTTFASAGGGCWTSTGQGLTPKRCHVGVAQTLTTAALTQSRSRTARESPVVKKLQPSRIFETYSSGVKLALVARGDVDLFVNIYPEFNDWDVCAGHILVEEAGGKVTNLRGEPIRYGAPGNKQRAGMIASNGILHEHIIRSLA